MKFFNFTTLIFISLLFAFSFSAASAQEEPGTLPAPNQTVDKNQRPNLMAELGLTLDQLEQIKRINQQSKSQMRDAQQRLREANQSLDEAIYADAIDELNIKARLKDAQTAQAEVRKLRSMTELAVRRILTPEQLVKFREVRQRFMQNLENKINQPRRRQVNNLNKRINNLRPNN